MNDRNKRKSRIWRNWIIVVLSFAGIGITVSVLMFSSWSQFKTATPAQATRSFEAVLEGLEDRRPYVTISESGQVDVDRTLEMQPQGKLKALNLLAFEPGAGRTVRIRFPFWFVKVKTTNSINLGTFVTLLSNDWDHLDLSVSETELQQRGPGLVLDHKRPDGGRILLWSE